MFLLSQGILTPWNVWSQNLKTDSLLKIVKTTQSDNIKIDALLKLADFYSKNNNNSLAEKTYLQAIALSRQTKNKRLKAKTLKQAGIYYFSQNNPKNAQVYFQEALLLYRNLKDTSKICIIYNNMHFKKSLRDIPRIDCSC